MGVDEHLAGVVIHLPGEDIKQGSFATAISAQNGNPLPLLNLKGQIFQQVFANDKKLC